MSDRAVADAGVAVTAAFLIAVAAGCAPRVYTTANPAPPCAGTISRDTVAVRAGFVDPKPVQREVALSARDRKLASSPLKESVVLRFTVLATGQVDTASVRVVSSTDTTITPDAIARLLASRFWPGCRGGEAVAVKDVQQKLSFGGSAPEIRLPPFPSLLPPRSGP